MEESVNYAEYTVEQKPEGKYKAIRAALIAFYVLFLVGGLALFIGVLKLWPVGAVLPFITWIIWGWTWRYGQCEHKVEVVNAKLKITDIHGAGKKNAIEKVICEEFIKDFALIAPMTDEYKDKYSNADKLIDARSSANAREAYFALLEKDGKKTVIMFEVVNKMIKSMKFYNKNNTVVTTVSH